MNSNLSEKQTQKTCNMFQLLPHSTISAYMIMINQLNSNHGTIYRHNGTTHVTSTSKSDD